MLLEPLDARLEVVISRLTWYVLDACPVVHFFALSFLKDNLQLLGLLRNHLVTGCQKHSSSRKLDINVNKIIVWEENLLLVLLSYLL